MSRPRGGRKNSLVPVSKSDFETGFQSLILYVEIEKQF